VGSLGPAIDRANPTSPILSSSRPLPALIRMQTSTNALYRNADKENFRGQSSQTTSQIATDSAPNKKKQDSGGWVRRPSEKVRHAVHEHEETAQWRNAKAQKERERRRRHHLMEEGSENKDEENSEEGRDIDNDDDEEEEDGTQVPPIFFFCAPY